MYVAGRDNTSCNYTDCERLHIANKDNVNREDRKCYPEIIIKCKNHSDLI